MKLRNVIVVGLTGVAAMAPQVGGAQETSCNPPGTTCSPLTVQLDVVIAPVMRFQIGATGQGAIATFTTTEANVGNGTAVTPALTGAGNASGVYYKLMSNRSTSTAITVSATPTAGYASGLTTVSTSTAIPWADITVASNAINSKDSIGWAGTSAIGTGLVTVNGTSNIVDAEGYFAYQYKNTALYPAATYTGKIDYTISQP